VTAFFFSSASGRIALILFGLDILLPYLLRRTRLSALLGPANAPNSPYLHRMWPHYWCGYVLLAFSLVHAWLAMDAVSMKRMNMIGLWFATIALGLLLLQVALGLLLRDKLLPTRKLLRGWHYWIMIALAVLIAGHAWLNG
jgi:hypothetical protein